VQKHEKNLKKERQDMVMKKFAEKSCMSAKIEEEQAMASYNLDQQLQRK
jgi:hypothetical protein